MGFFTQEVSQEKIDELKEKKEALKKELEMREAQAAEEREIEELKKKLDKVKPAKWTNQFR